MRRIRASWVRVAVVVAAMATTAHAQPRVVTAPGGRGWVLGGWWRQNDGLPQDRVTALLQTRDGYLWVGTRNGIGRFDGVRFTTWGSGAAGDPPEGEVYSVAEHPSGDVWLTVYGGGLIRHDRGRFTTFGTAEGLVDNYARAVAVAPDRSVWVGTDRGLSREFEGRFSDYHAGEGTRSNAIRALHIDSDGTVYAGTERGLYRVRGQALERVTLPGDTNEAAVEALMRDSRRRLWVATSNGVACLDGDRVTVVGRAQGVSANVARYVYEDSVGRIWIATMAGADCAQPADTAALRFVPVVTGGDAAVVLEDHEHSVWVGFRGHGLLRLQPALFSVVGVSRGLPSDSTSAVFQARDGTMWIGAGTSLSAVTPGGVVNFGVADGLPDRPVSSLAEDADGRLWVGTEAGLYRATAPVACAAGPCRARFVAVGGHPALREHVRVLLAEDGAMLAGTNSSGVLRISPGHASVVAAVVPGEVRAMLRESAGLVWVGTRDRGLGRLTPGGTTWYTTTEGLPHIAVQSLHHGRDGTLWIGTRKGLAWLRDGRLDAITVANGLHQSHVYGITSDASGRLWLSSGNGISTLSPDDVYDLAAGLRATVVPTVFTAEHGLPSSLCALSHDPVITTATDGRVWVATLGGAVSVNPADATPQAHPLAVLVESTAVEGVDVLPGEVAEARHQRGSLFFRFTVPSFVAPGQIRYRYRLVGFDGAWVDGGSSREARFTNIPPGRYAFEVEAAHGAGAWSAPATVSVSLTPRLYQRAWFSVLAALALVGTTVGLVLLLQRAHVRRLRAREQELAARVEESLAQIKVLRGLLPLCAWCHRVRDDAGYWTQMEAYIRDHSQAEFSHSLCPDCLKTHFPDEAGGTQGHVS